MAQYFTKSDFEETLQPQRWLLNGYWHLLEILNFRGSFLRVLDCTYNERVMPLYSKATNIAFERRRSGTKPSLK
jgi:hypothetical protein